MQVGEDTCALHTWGLRRGHGGAGSAAEAPARARQKVLGSAAAQPHAAGASRCRLLFAGVSQMLRAPC